jgi:predicted O-linked N-acetylglucosamine transferase (SPINDLY family)
MTDLRILNQPTRTGAALSAVGATNFSGPSPPTMAEVTDTFASAIAYREAGDYVKAESWLTERLVAQPDDAQTLAHLAHIQMLRKRDAVAHTTLVRAEAIAPDDPLILRNRARLALRAQRIEVAASAAARALAADPANPENRLVQAAVLGAQGEAQRALQALEALLTERPDFAEALANRALLHLRGRNTTAALADAHRALEIKPHLSHLWRLLVSIHAQAMRTEDAFSALRRYCELEPEDAAALADFGDLLRQKGLTEEAFKVLSRAVEIAPNLVAAWVSYGAALQQAKRFDDAVIAYKKALAFKPDLAEVHNNLGIALKDQGKLDEAVACYRQALNLKPDFAEAHSNLGNALKDQGKLDEAVACYRQALVLKPDSAAAQSNLGIALNESGKLDEAVACYRQALVLKPDFAEAHSNLGIALKDQGKLDEAMACYREALVLKPDFANAHNNLGIALKEQGKLDEAVACYRQALFLKLDYAEAHYNLGDALQQQGKLAEAVASYRHALVLKPDFAEAYCNLGIALKDQGKLDEAVACYRQALNLKPDFAEAHSNLGNALNESGKLDEAVACYRRALVLKPDFAAAQSNLGNALKDQGKLDEAMACYRQALVVKPEYAEAHSNLLMSLHYAARHSDADILAEAQSFARQVEKSRPSRNFLNTTDPHRRLRIGYVSADFRAHPVGYFLAPVIAAHDRATVEVICYNNSAVTDPMTTRIREAADQWRTFAGVPDADASAMIQGDGIDVLVDLSGHTAKNRLLLFAIRSAPVQVTWLGYFGTTGVAAMDYILADRFVVLPGEKTFFTERVWRLPDSYLCFAPPEFDVPIIARPVTPAEPLTLGCFNNWAKVSPGTVSLWAEILGKMPGTQLFLKTKSLHDPAVSRDAMDRFAAHGIGPERLILEGHASRAELLAAYNRVDIGLDPFPFGGGTTTAEALWMGVPVVTLRGDRWVGRVSESILATVGLSDLVAEDRDSYVRTVVTLADDRPRLSKMRHDLRPMMKGSAFCDGPRFARSIEAAYRGMWNAWCAGRATEER